CTCPVWYTAWQVTPNTRLNRSASSSGEPTAPAPLREEDFEAVWLPLQRVDDRGPSVRSSASPPVTTGESFAAEKHRGGWREPHPAEPPQTALSFRGSREASHDPDLHASRPGEGCEAAHAGRVRGVPQDGQLVGPSPALPCLRPRRLLRPVTEQARH